MRMSHAKSIGLMQKFTDVYEPGGGRWAKLAAAPHEIVSHFHLENGVHARAMSRNISNNKNELKFFPSTMPGWPHSNSPALCSGISCIERCSGRVTPVRKSFWRLESDRVWMRSCKSTRWSEG